MTALSKNNIVQILAVLVPLLFTFPFFKESISTFLLILVVIFTLFHTLLTKNYTFINKSYLYITIPFWIILFRCLFDFSMGSFGHVKNALFFMVFPITFYYLPASLFTAQKVRFYLTLLKNVSTVMALGYLIMFLYYYDFNDFFVYKYNIPKFRDFVYNEVPFFKIHPTYFTAIVFFCSAVALENLLKNKAYWELVYLTVFVGITFLLLVKINIVLLFLLMGWMILFRSGLNMKQKISVFVAFIAGVVLMISIIPGIKNRFTEMIDSYNRPPSGLAYDSTNIRVAIVNCSIELAKDNYLWGVGFSNLGNSLENCFASKYDTDFFVNKKYLTHNYFFYIFISSGIIGGFFILLFLFKIIVATLKINSFLATVGLANILILNFTEDFLYRHYGLFYFCLLFFTFYKMYSEKLNSESII